MLAVRTGFTKTYRPRSQERVSAFEARMAALAQTEFAQLDDVQIERRYGFFDGGFGCRIFVTHAPLLISTRRGKRAGRKHPARFAEA